jgi:ABC-type transport system involved in cytochrome c biogenesis ATPase subunit
MRIVQLTAENFKRLRVVSITPDGNLVQITGRNGQGKSSVLDSIWAALGGKDAIQSVPIRKGAETAAITLDLGDIKVTRKFTAAGGTTLTVENADGARYPSPQKMLDGLIGAIAFDPLEFSRMQPAQQFAQLRSLVKLDVDIDDLDAKNATDFAKRTEINRESKRLRAVLAGMPAVPDDLPPDPIDTAALVDEIARAGEHNADIERRRGNRKTAADSVERLTAEIKEINDSLPGKLAASERRYAAIVADLQAQIEALQARIVKVNADADEERTTFSDEAANETRERAEQLTALQAKIDAAQPLPDPIDAAEVRARLTAATATNEQIAQRTARAKAEADAVASEAAADTLTQAMADRGATKAKAIAAAAMPVPDLGFGDGIVTLSDLPFDQASSAEQLRVSCAIAMAMNPKLRVLRIKDGSLLDEDGLALLATMADEHDTQIWIERVASGDKVGIVLEDGHIQGVEQPPEPEPVAELHDLSIGVPAGQLI